MTNKLRDIFAHILRGLPEIRMPEDQHDPRDDIPGLVIDLYSRYMHPSDKTKKRWVIWFDKLPTEYETGETADKTTVDKIDKWLVKQARILDRNLYSAFKMLEDDDSGTRGSGKTVAQLRRVQGMPPRSNK